MVTATPTPTAAPAVPWTPEPRRARPGTAPGAGRRRANRRGGARTPAGRGTWSPGPAGERVVRGIVGLTAVALRPAVVAVPRGAEGRSAQRAGVVEVALQPVVDLTGGAQQVLREVEELVHPVAELRH